jgi:hypothetical protein
VTRGRAERGGVTGFVNVFFSSLTGFFAGGARSRLLPKEHPSAGEGKSNSEDRPPLVQANFWIFSHVAHSQNLLMYKVLRDYIGFFTFF